MSHETIFKVSEATATHTLTDKSRAAAMRAEAKEDPEGFWAKIAQRLDWSKPFTKIKDVSFAADDLHVRWFYDGELNACVNCLDRHLPARANDPAISIVIAPPPAIAQGTPTARAATPLSNAPSSFDAPMNTPSTVVTRPSWSSGVASGTSDRHVKSLAEAVYYQAKAAGEMPLGMEGANEGEWALVDLNGVVVHGMQQKVRDFYQLERLWNIDPAEAEKVSREHGSG